MYEFQPPPNFTAIRTNIIRRVREKRQRQRESRKESCDALRSLTPPVHCHTDNGLPSPPVESCHYEPSKQNKEDAEGKSLLEFNKPTQFNNDGRSSGMTPPSLAKEAEETSLPGTPFTDSATESPSSSSSSSTTRPPLDEETIRQRIRELQQEKHELFQIMKGLLSRQPSPDAPTPRQEEESSSTTGSSSSSEAARMHAVTTTTTTTSNNEQDKQQHQEPCNTKEERSRSRERETYRSSRQSGQRLPPPPPPRSRYPPPPFDRRSRAPPSPPTRYSSRVYGGGRAYSPHFAPRGFPPPSSVPFPYPVRCPFSFFAHSLFC